MILAQALELPIQTVEKQRPQADESVRLEITLTKEEYENFKKAQELNSHALRDQGVACLINHLVTKELKKYQKTTVAAKVILKRDTCCQFVDSTTGKQCESKSFLQVDHITPRFAGGTDDPTNKRVLCGEHNRYRYRVGANIRAEEHSSKHYKH